MINALIGRTIVLLLVSSLMGLSSSGNAFYCELKSSDRLGDKTAALEMDHQNHLSSMQHDRTDVQAECHSDCQCELLNCGSLGISLNAPFDGFDFRTRIFPEPLPLDVTPAFRVSPYRPPIS